MKNKQKRRHIPCSDTITLSKYSVRHVYPIITIIIINVIIIIVVVIVVVMKILLSGWLECYIHNINIDSVRVCVYLQLYHMVMYPNVCKAYIHTLTRHPFLCMHVMQSIQIFAPYWLSTHHIECSIRSSFKTTVLRPKSINIQEITIKN